jgi:hypothetical protein
MAVCERNYNLLTGEAYGNDFIGIAPAKAKPGTPWCCTAGTIRSVSETKGGAHQDKSNSGGSCC